MLAALTIFASGRGWAQQYEFDRFRNTLIDYFKQQNYFPVLVNRGYAVGDVVNVDGVNFYARAARCFPKLKLPDPVSAALSDVVETDAAGMNFGLRLRSLFGSSAGADLVRRIQLKFTDVTTVSAALLDLREALDRRVCSEIAPLIDGTITPVDKNQEPFFVVSEVVYGKREAKLQLNAGGDLQAKAERLGSQIGDANLKMTASTDGLVTLTSDVVVPIAVRRMIDFGFSDSNASLIRAYFLAMIGVVAVHDRYDREHCLRAGRIWQRAHLLATARNLAGRPCNESVEMIDHEKALGKPALRAGLLAEVLGDATWQPTFVFYMGYPKTTARASPRRSLESVVL